ncbi:hypothetical protein ACLE20_15095 [Rhizobium sp. YIM 134829]|uniref:hypothetical protein n=1 Tax=Rhizobium sp. YIM 134829 TaxID=3390453 RepID=UPI00397B58AD
MTKIINLADRELESKVEIAVRDVAASGVDPSTMSAVEQKELSRAAWETLSPEAKKRAAMEGLELIARRVLGEYIAEQIWLAGYGWAATKKQIAECGSRTKIHPDDVVDCLEAFRTAHVDFTAEEAADFKSLSRFMPLFVMQSAETTLGEAAARKAAAGDKLALSFLAWKEIA